MTATTTPRRRRSPAFTAALALVGAFLLLLTVPNVGPVLRAARADGTAGEFTARRLYCVQHPGHESCSWTGDFASADGRVRRTGVALYGSDRGTLTAGRTTPAVDVGRRGTVYGPGGSNEWVFTSLLILAGLAVIVLAFRPVRRTAPPDAPSP
ncbi:hypothetical protein Sru01_12700 [Sphaerisporangium rufum]|uniref:Uncharacterized protein n=1 Tax=Sphaerisporangium rufum TaxID=1381558 RepID=A0A919V046_9ACTN|nr:hypothetical protein [Sphaerisporangium rufum]GII76288.1 hypothetical protein Sru01_12700 [Sphaerisporangium rufum]